MLCQECKQKQATVHMTKIINHKKTESHLCEDCARSHEDFIQGPSFSLNDLIFGFMDMGHSQKASEKPVSSECGVCGMDYKRFKKMGRLGCGECYKFFENELGPVLGRIHGNTQHTGKVPKRAGSDLQIKRQITRLRGELKRAIELEAFEQAALLRDEIKELEKPQELQEGDANELDK
ncbi:MAG TPA: hypothetical protein DIW17_12065 [Clostridiales bacterium]|nr:UvrB/UvrC motif-containing protein [Clostridia bacterium]HCS74594.1 hypothetical protein [Clostridiales bacterium]